MLIRRPGSDAVSWAGRLGVSAVDLRSKKRIDSLWLMLNALVGGQVLEDLHSSIFLYRTVSRPLVSRRRDDVLGVPATSEIPPGTGCIGHRADALQTALAIRSMHRGRGGYKLPPRVVVDAFLLSFTSVLYNTFNLIY
jgi:hypothetical protein